MVTGRSSQLTDIVRRFAARLTPRSPGTRSTTVALLGLAALAFMVTQVNDKSPLTGWLAVPLGVIVGWQVVLNLAWISMGVAITGRLLPPGLPRLERLAIGVAVGVTAFYLALYLLAALGLLGRVSALLVLASFLVAGLPAGVRWLRARARPGVILDMPALRGLSLAATIAGAMGLALLYLGAFSPVAVNYDATWVHLTIAEAYAREGRLLPFSGDWTRCYPYLASVLHTVDFLVPGLDGLATRCMMALHTEISLVLWTMVGVAAAINWMVGRLPVRGAWAVFLLFPGIFVYDGNVGGAADHTLAFFGPPLFLLSVRASAVRSIGIFGLWGALAAAAVMTKYQGAYVVAPLGVVLVVATWRSWQEVSPPQRRRARRLLAAAGTLGAAFVVVAAPHFIKNVVFHANPVYPLLQDQFSGSHPTVRDATEYVDHILVDDASRAPRDLGRRVLEALRLTFTFAFRPHYSFLGERPSFGFAFTLALPLLLVVPNRRRLAIGCLVSLGALFLWGFTYRVDRNLQTFMPLLAASAAALMIRAWRVGLLARVGVGALVVGQLVWAGDLFFEGQGRYLSAFSLFASEREGRSAKRFDQFFADAVGIERSLPENAVLMLHHAHLQLGLDRNVYLDIVGFQGVIDYRDFREPRQLHQRLRALGVTHVVHMPGNQQANSMQEEAIFDSFLAGATVPKTRIGGLEVFPLPADAPPTRTSPLEVLMVGIGGYADGVYPVATLDANTAMPGRMQHFRNPGIPASPAQFARLAGGTDVVMVGRNAPADDALTNTLNESFTIAAAYGGMTVYVRRAPTA